MLISRFRNPPKGLLAKMHPANQILKYFTDTTGVIESGQSNVRTLTMQHKFQVGEIVMLKSGGPEMTVSQITNNRGTPLIRTTWFEGGELKRGQFPEESLKSK